MNFDTEARPDICVKSDTITQEYVLNHTVLRVRDPKRLLDLYSRVLDMHLLHCLDFKEDRFSLRFLVMTRSEEISNTAGEYQRYTFGRQPALELTHNWGSESDDSQCHGGDQGPRGFGYICLSVPDLVVACKRLKTPGVDFVKPSDRGMKNVTFTSDPSGYQVEVV